MTVSDQTTRLDGRVAIVTGAGGGLGRSHALLLASLGAHVVVNDLGSSVSGDSSDSSRAGAVVREIVEAGGVAIADTSSVSTPADAASLVAHTVDRFGRLDIVVNNAGVLNDFPMDDFRFAAWQRVLDVHLGGTMFVTASAWPYLAERGGSIVSTTSATGLFGNDGQAAYGAAKAGIIGLTRCWAVEGASVGIRANAIAPLAVTRMTDRGDRERVTGVERTTASDVMGDIFRDLKAEHVSPLVAWLAHDDCASNGQVYSVGGGRIARVEMIEARGWVDLGLDIESIRAHWDLVNDLSSPPPAPRSLVEEFALYSQALAPLRDVPTAAGHSAGS